MKNILESWFSKAKTEHFILSRSVLVISASMLGNVFAYLFQIASGRYLTVEDYSILVSLFSLSGILLMLTQPITGGVTKLVAEIKDQDYPHKISSLFFSLLKFHSFAGFLIFIVMILGADLIGWYLRIEDRSLIYVFAVAILAGNIIGFMGGFLQGLMRFKAYSLVSFLTSFTKFLTVLIVIYLGLGVRDIFSGLAIFTITVGLISIALLKKNIKFNKYPFDYTTFNKLVKYSLLSSLGIASVILMQNLDVVIVKHHFSELIAGIYGSTTVIGRIVFFAASPVAIVMLPICSDRFNKKQDYFKPFLYSLVITLLIALGIFSFYLLFPNFVINVLFGAKYLGALNYLGYYSLYMVLFTILNLLIVFLISVSRFGYASLSIIAPITEFIGLQIFNDNLFQIITVNISSTLLAIVILTIMVFRTHQKYYYADK